MLRLLQEALAAATAHQVPAAVALSVAVVTPSVAATAEALTPLAEVAVAAAVHTAVVRTVAVTEVSADVDNLRKAKTANGFLPVAIHILHYNETSGGKIPATRFVFIFYAI